MESWLEPAEEETTATPAPAGAEQLVCGICKRNPDAMASAPNSTSP